MKTVYYQYLNLSLLTAILLLLAFDRTDTDDQNSDPSASSEESEREPELSAWIINNETTSSYMLSSDGDPILTYIQSAEVSYDDDNNAYVYVTTNGIPNYDVTMTQALVDELNDRPNAETDFVRGATTAEAGEQVLFGQNIGFDSSNVNCNTTGGKGYWPPGPECPTLYAKEVYFPVTPTVSDKNCATGLQIIGLFVDGSAMYNWSDGFSYSYDLWYTVAPEAEQYDLDICSGHSANNEYHHHNYTTCLADLVGDDASSHSPIYGYAADGYPVYGPYESADTLAISGWVTRDYGASNEAGGCETEGQRSCVLVNEYDISQGVKYTAKGPDVGETVTTPSKNSIAAVSGYYYEDYYYAGTTVEGAQLDEYNGHDTNDGKGYHYHITLKMDDEGDLTPAFPYIIGPRFKGELADNAMTVCSDVN